MAQNPMMYAAAVRTNWRRLIRNLRRACSVASSATDMILICSGVIGPGSNSPFEQG